MTMKIAVSAIALALVASTACFSAPASAQDVRVSIPNSHVKKMIQQAAQRGFTAGYRAGLRRNSNAYATRIAYSRGYSDAMNRMARNSGRYVATSAARYPDNVVTNESLSARYGSNYGDAYARYTGAVDRNDRNDYNDRRSYNNYNNGYSYDNGYSAQARYDYGFNPIGGLLNIVFAPFAAASNFATQNDRYGYCAGRYQSFDAGSGTYLASDGNRYYCS